MYFFRNAFNTFNTSTWHLRSLIPFIRTFVRWHIPSVRPLARVVAGLLAAPFARLQFVRHRVRSRPLFIRAFVRTSGSFATLFARQSVPRQPPSCLAVWLESPFFPSTVVYSSASSFLPLFYFVGLYATCYGSEICQWERCFSHCTSTWLQM